MPHNGIDMTDYNQKIREVRQQRDCALKSILESCSEAIDMFQKQGSEKISIYVGEVKGARNRDNTI